MISMNSQSVNVDRVELIKVLIANRSQHAAEYNAAINGYKQAMLDTLAKTIKDVENGVIDELNLRLPKPMSHEAEYTHAIEMYDESVDAIINLSSDAFRAYYKDKWNWSIGFKSLISVYSAS